MKRTDRIKLDFIRNWKLPGKERLSHLLSPSKELKQQIKNGIIWLNNEDIALYTTADNYIEWTILTIGTYEDEISKLIRVSLKPGDTALDVGGNIGLQSIRMAQAVGTTGNIIAFEPLNYLQKKFIRNITLNRINNVKLLPYALSDTESETEFSINENSWNQGTFSLNNSSGAHKQNVIIKIGDNLPDLKKVKNLALIKIDVEGFENYVLRGLKDTIVRHKPRIIFEYDSNYWAATSESIGNCFALLVALGYKLYQITSVGCKPIANATSVVSGNIFCIAE